MNEIRTVALMGVLTVAVYTDLQSERIPNSVIATGLLLGLFYQLFAERLAGLVIYCGGILLPVLALFGLYYFRMIGAGDIKLLSVVGGFLGPAGGAGCLFLSFLIGSVIAVFRIISSRNMVRRLTFLAVYVRDYAATGRWSSYLGQTERSARIHFSVPVLLAVVCYLSGMC